MNDGPIVLQPAVGDQPPTLVIGQRRVPLDMGTSILWVQILNEWFAQELKKRTK